MERPPPIVQVDEYGRAIFSANEFCIKTNPQLLNFHIYIIALFRSFFKQTGINFQKGLDIVVRLCYNIYITRKEVPKMTEKKITPQERYAAKYKKQYKLDCFTSTEQDIIDKLESVPNRAGYIKSLIRADIAASKAKQTE